MAERPAFLSPDFHLRFLPAVIARRLRGSPAAGTRFTSGLDLMILAAVCGVLLAIGMPGALQGTPVPTALAAVGGAGLAALSYLSIRSEMGQPVRWEAFDVGVFFFCIALGASAGLWSSILTDPDRFTGAGFRQDRTAANALWAAGGAVAGYGLGIPAALWIQKLGPLRFLFTVMAWPGIAGLVVADLVIASA